MAKSSGHMYNFVTHTANPLAGACAHGCTYCYVNRLKKFYKNIDEKYTGVPRISEAGLKEISGKGKKIFVCDMTDLFADNVPFEIIDTILERCRQYPANQYLFQTKNVKRLFNFADKILVGSIIATTIETNRRYPQMGKAPQIDERAEYMNKLSNNFIKHITIEPLMSFDLEKLVNLIKLCQPQQVNIGLDSGNNHLFTPLNDKIIELITHLKPFTEVHLKDGRLMILNIK